MIGARSFDEVNDLVTNKRGIDFEEYFSTMDLSKGEKEKRVELAKRLNDQFLVVVSLLFMAQKYSTNDYELIRNQFVEMYKNAILGVIAIDSYMSDYIEQISHDVIESTLNNPDDPYYVSPDRAVFMAENEANTCWNHQEFEDAIENGATKKQWLDIRDKRERKTHIEVGGKIKPIQEPFAVGDSLLDYPKDTKYGADAKEIVNCRCSIRYF